MLGLITLAEVAPGYSFNVADFASIGTTVASGVPVAIAVGAGVMALSIGLGFVVRKIRMMAK